MTPQGLLEYVEPRDLHPHDVVLTRAPLSRGQTHQCGEKFCVVTRISLGDRAGAFTVSLQHWSQRDAFETQLNNAVLVLVGAEGRRHSWPQEPKRPMLVLPRRR